MSGPKGQLGEPLQVSLREVNGGLDYGHAAAGAVDEGIPVGVRRAGASEEAVPLTVQQFYGGDALGHVDDRPLRLGHEVVGHLLNINASFCIKDKTA